MAITLNLKHTFTTRVVWSSEEIATTRKTLTEALKMGLIKQGLEDYTRETLALEDEAFVLTFVKGCFRQNFREDLSDLLKLLDVTRISPLQTEVVA